MDRPLTAYSCGGSSGVEPDSLLAAALTGDGTSTLAIDTQEGKTSRMI